jgi:Glycosyltransferase (GlcNAc)
MENKSIYVSIACLGFDSELISTVKTCVDNASKNNKLKISIACVGDYLFYENTINQLSNYKNITIKYYGIKNNYGVGKGRTLAAKFYNNEDYFLQIDSHTLFLNNWDTTLISTFKKAKQKNKGKIILTAVPPKYSYMNIDYKKHVAIAYQEFSYSYWIKNEKRFNKIPMFSDNSFKELFPEKHEDLKNNIFCNSIKVCAAFIFGDKDFASNTCLDESILFWEEEILQSIELVDKGFILLYPNIKSPVYHYFLDANSDPNSRTKISNLLDELEMTMDDYFNIMKNNYISYMNEPKNYNKIKAFEAYSDVSLI